MGKLEKELSKRGTAEISNGVVTQVTQALSESDTEAEMLVFGELTKTKLRPIDECCPTCDSKCKRDKGVEYCREFQRKEGAARGFNKVICTRQFID